MGIKRDVRGWIGAKVLNNIPHLGGWPCSIENKLVLKRFKLLWIFHIMLWWTLGIDFLMENLILT